MPSAELSQAEIQRLQRPFGGAACLGSPGNLTVQAAGRWRVPALGSIKIPTRRIRCAPPISWCAVRSRFPGIATACWRFPTGTPGPAPLFHRGVLVVEGVHCAGWMLQRPHALGLSASRILADWADASRCGRGGHGQQFPPCDDAVFVRTGDRCLKIDLATGKLAAEFKTPMDATSPDRNWGYVAFADGVLFGSVLNHAHMVSPRYQGIGLRTESVLAFALDSGTGQVLWKYKPEHSIRNNAVAIAAGRVYLIDRPLAMADRITEPKPDGKHRPLLRPGEHSGGTLLAFDARSGKELWRTSDDVFGTQVAVSAQHGVLLMYYQGVKHNFFKLPSEIGGRMAALSVESGSRLWDREADYKTRPIINGEVIYAEGGAWKLKTGEAVPWKFERSYGCGQIVSSCHLMLFRSATLGYLDLSRDAGTENFGGIRSSCWFNAIPAGGQVLVPDGSSKCAAVTKCRRGWPCSRNRNRPFAAIDRQHSMLGNVPGCNQMGNVRLPDRQAGRHAGVSLWGPTKFVVTDPQGSRLEECVCLFTVRS